MAGLDNKTANNNNSSNETQEKKKRQYKPQDVYTVLTQARKKFNDLFPEFQNADTKLKSIEMSISSRYKDPQNFWGDFKKEIDKLENSKRFCKSCEDKGLDPFVVAGHIIFLGKQKKDEALEEGIEKFGGHGLYRKAIFNGDRNSFDSKYFGKAD